MPVVAGCVQLDPVRQPVGPDLAPVGPAADLQHAGGIRKGGRAAVFGEQLLMGQLSDFGEPKTLDTGIAFGIQPGKAVAPQFGQAV